MEYQFRNLSHIADYLAERAAMERKNMRPKEVKMASERAATYESIASMLRQTRLTEQTITYRRARWPS